MTKWSATPLRLTAPLLLSAVLYGGGVASSRCVSATGIGCVFVSDGTPGEITPRMPDCQEFGSGCYGCFSHRSGAAGYVVCAMLPDGTQPLCVNTPYIPGAGWPGSSWDWIPPPGGGGGGLGGGGGDPCTVGPSQACPAECASCGRRAY
jgi:hypothetical protein